MASENTIQALIHKLEEGGWAKHIRLALLLASILAVSLYLLFWNFRGLSSADGMDQAQIGREIARGNGFSTKFFRPVQIAQYIRKRGEFSSVRVPDVYHAPLYSVVLSPFLWLARGTWDMDPESGQYIYFCDRIVAGLGIVFFLLAVWINYFTACRLFDRTLAILGTGLTLVCGTFWNLALSGLPQMLMLLLFSAVTYCMVRAIEAHYVAKPKKVWIVATGALFGLLLLTNALTLWLLLGAVAFVLMLFRPRGHDAAIILVIAVLMFAPWMYRTYRVSGNPLGIAAYSLLDGVRGSESEVMRSFTTGVEGVSLGAFRSKMQNQLGDHLASLIGFLGRSLVAPVFFLALMHTFKRSETSMFRWAVLLMWLAALVGMCLAGTDSPMSPNNLHVLFIPLMTFYGLAFLLVLWNRIGLDIPVARIAFLTFLFVVSALPLVATLRGGRGVQWPPYFPQYTAILNNWFGEDEIIVSDQPWAVAWYGDRKSLWVPESPKIMVDLHDFRRLGASLSALYLTPISGHRPFMPDIVRGEWKEWATFVMRSPRLTGFPLQAVTGFLGGEIILVADTARWEGKMPEKGAMVEAEEEAKKARQKEQAEREAGEVSTEARKEDAPAQP